MPGRVPTWELLLPSRMRVIAPFEQHVATFHSGAFTGEIKDHVRVWWCFLRGPSPIILAMAEVTEPVPYTKGEKPAHDFDEKVSYDSDSKGVDDADIVREVEVLEERIQNDEATAEEYLIQDGSDVALKVFTVLRCVCHG